MGVTGFAIQITNNNNGVFWAGETIEGFVLLTISSQVTCRGVKIKLQGEGHCYWETGSGDNKREYTGHRSYVNSRQTLVGNFYPTECLSNAGEAAFWDPETGSGDMAVPIEDGNWADIALAVRVMDYDWGRKDDLLGDVMVFGSELSEVPRSFPIRHKNKQNGEVTLSAKVTKSDATGATWLTVTAHQATGLRSADFFGRNDVYVQCYKIPSSTNKSDPMPPPTAAISLGQGQHRYPFKITIPSNNMPSSYERCYGRTCKGYIRYSLYANVDIKYCRDPSTRMFITVLGSDCPQPCLLSPSDAQESAREMYNCDCCSIQCSKEGDVSLRSGVSRLCGAPGELINVNLTARNLGEKGIATVSVVLEWMSIWSSNGSSTRWDSYDFELSPGENIMPGGVLEWSQRQLQLPVCPPSFGGKPGRTKWTSQNPVRWGYTLTFRVHMASSVLKQSFPFFIGAMPNNVIAEIQPQCPECRGQGCNFCAGSRAPGPVYDASADGIAASVMRVRLGDDRFFERQPVADLRNAAVSVTPSNVPAGSCLVDAQEDAANVGQLPSYVPSYPVPTARSQAVAPAVAVAPQVSNTMGDSSPAQQGSSQVQVEPEGGWVRQ